MKKILSVILTVIICLGNLPAIAEDMSSLMKNALVAVKTKIDVPPEAENFESNSHTNNNNTYFSFDWHDAEHNLSINVECDAKGRISSYYYYKFSETDSTKLSLTTKEQIFEHADAFMRKALPELFENPDDCLVYNESKSSGRVNYNNTTYTFVYDRIHSGIPVLGNTATIRVSATGEDIQINNMHCSWYYDCEFESSEAFEGDITDEYFNEYPIELIYNKQYSYRPLKISDKPEESNPVLLIYRFRDGEYGYISASTGEKITADHTDEYGMTTEATADMAAGGLTKNSARLTEAELKELDQIQGLISREEAEKKLKSYDELKITDLKSDSFSVNSNEGKYYINLSMNSENADENHYFYASLNGQTGEILNINNHIYGKNEKKPDSKDYDEAAKLAEGFIKKIAPDKVKESVLQERKENDSTVSYTRLVNEVEYIDNTINSYADASGKYISYYNISWDDDVSSFADPSNAISQADAETAINTVAPIKEIYVLSGGRFVKCVAPATDRNIKLDAFTGELIGNNNSEEVVIKYTDTDGHWAESMIRALADVGIGLVTDKLNPDSAISQADFLRLMLSTFRSPSVYRTCDTDELYEAASDIIPEEERNENAEIRREDAFFYMINFMGYEAIAKMDIFRSDFADSTGLDGERLGAVALLTGFGVVKGDDGNIRAADSITTAETVALIYNYLTKN